MRFSVLTTVLFGIAGITSGCNDLTEPLPAIAGTYRYASTSSTFPSLTRRGTITIVDADRRTARFDGEFEITAGGDLIRGRLSGAFMSADRIWFRFLNEKFEYHEAQLGFGSGHGEIFFQGLTYTPTGATFSLELVR